MYDTNELPNFTIRLNILPKQIGELVELVGEQFFDAKINTLRADGWSSIPINLDELYKYIQFQMVLKRGIQQQDNYISNFRKCTEDDFALKRIDTFSWS